MKRSFLSSLAIAGLIGAACLATPATAAEVVLAKPAPLADTDLGVRTFVRVADAFGIQFFEIKDTKLVEPAPALIVAEQDHGWINSGVALEIAFVSAASAEGDNGLDVIAFGGPKVGPFLGLEGWNVPPTAFDHIAEMDAGYREDFGGGTTLVAEADDGLPGVLGDQFGDPVEHIDLMTVSFVQPAGLADWKVEVGPAATS